MRSLAAFLLGCLLTAGLGYWLASGRLDAARDATSALQKTLDEVNGDLLGYTRYRTYLGAGQQSLAAQMKFLAATVTREENATRVLEKSMFGISSSGMVAISYTAEYSFGFDLQPASYEVRSTRGGIEVRVGKPMLVASPAVQNLQYQILSGGLFTDEKGAVIHLYEEAAARTREEGQALALTPAVQALCEKKLVEFLHDFLARQLGVKFVPQITVVYK